MATINNTSSLIALNELDRNTNRLGKDLKKVASGMKINSAGDAAAEYSISEKMRVQIRSLNQDIDNVKKGKDLLQTANGGIQNIIDQIRTMKAMAINSANDTNTDIDRQILEKGFQKHIEVIDQLASETNYNGIPLLDGRWYAPHNALVAYTVVIDSGNSGSTVNPPTPTAPTTSSPVRPTGNITIIPRGDYTISQDGVYQFAPDYYGNITVNANNVEIQQVTGNSVGRARIITKASGSTNLWINNINIQQSPGAVAYDGSFIEFNGGNNTLNLLGTNKFYTTTSIKYAMVNIGDGLDINDGGNGNGSLEVDSLGWSATGAGIGSDEGEQNTGTLTINSGKIISGTFNGAGLGSGVDATIGNVIIHGGDINSGSWLSGAGIGSGKNGTVLGDITIDGGKILADTQGSVVERGTKNYIDTLTTGAALGAGFEGRVDGSINITGGTITANDFGYGAGIGTGAHSDNGSSYVGSIIINNAEVHADSYYGEAVGIGSRDGGTTQMRRLLGTTNVVGSKNITGGTYSSNTIQLPWENEKSVNLYSYDRTETSSDPGSNPKPDPGANPEPTDPTEIRTETRYREEYFPGNPLIIHYGPKANQHLRVYINDMHAEAMGIADAVLDPREKALEAMGLLDNALEYALNESTRVGAYASRLDHTEDVLVTNSENTTSAESTIRDADMAKTMIEYTKESILSQASQSMLAQANQNKSIVLRLLS